MALPTSWLFVSIRRNRQLLLIFVLDIQERITPYFLQYSLNKKQMLWVQLSVLLCTLRTCNSTFMPWYIHSLPMFINYCSSADKWLSHCIGKLVKGFEIFPTTKPTRLPKSVLCLRWLFRANLFRTNLPDIWFWRRQV